MQQTQDRRNATYAAWSYFLGTGFAVGFGGLGTFLSAFWHNPALGLSLGAIVGLLLGFILLKLFGAKWANNLYVQQQRNNTTARVQHVQKRLPLIFFSAIGLVIGLGALGTPLGFGLHNMLLGFGISMGIGLIAGTVAGLFAGRK